MGITQGWQRERVWLAEWSHTHKDDREKGAVESESYTRVAEKMVWLTEWGSRTGRREREMVWLNGVTHNGDRENGMAG